MAKYPKSYKFRFIVTHQTDAKTAIKYAFDLTEIYSWQGSVGTNLQRICAVLFPYLVFEEPARSTVQILKLEDRRTAQNGALDGNSFG